MSMKTIRNWMNIIFMLGAIVGLLIYFFYRKETGTYVILAAMVVKFFEAFKIDVENRNVCAHADGDLARVHADRAAAEDHHVRLRRTGDARQQDAFAAELLLQVLRALLDGETARDLRHRGEAWQGAVGFLDRLVRDRLDLTLQQGVGLLLVCGEVQVGVEDQALVEEAVFARERLLHLHHHVDQMPHVRRVVDDARPGVHVFVVGEPGADPGAAFHVHVMPGGDVVPDVVRRESDAEFIVLDLFDASDFHGVQPFCLLPPK